MNTIQKICNILDMISEWTGKAFSWLIIPLTLLIVFEVITRRVLNAPTVWTFESSTFIYGAHFMLTAGYTLLHKGHVSVDIFSSRFSPKTRVLIYVIMSTVFLFPFVALIIWKGTIFAQTSWAVKERSWSTFQPPLYPIKTVIPIAGILFAMQGVSDFLKAVGLLLKGEKV